MSDLILDKSRGDYAVLTPNTSLRLGVIQFSKIWGIWVFKPATDALISKSDLIDITGMIESIEG